ncbi:hypothetical protein [Microlunatus flavus]|uniref:Uncharacterized protein n=1 Tax=Microlunatus flavus TaxID=1036181 RepID=A0A1H9H199_9ACTN|nr:hypothetical protein [Microlunatus flavus]SEQ56017.1 hypothetical protein SAMN05421756_10485 [Microlunatus flavus]
MRITHAIAAAALTAGLVAGAPAAAQAAPVAPPTAHAWHAQESAAPAKKAAKAKTKISADAPSEVKAGDDIEVTAKLTRKSGKKYKAYAGKKLELVLLDAPGADTGVIIDKRKTSKKGKVTFLLDTTDPEVAGQSYDFLVAYEGGSKAKASESDVFTVTVSS